MRAEKCEMSCAFRPFAAISGVLPPKTKSVRATLEYSFVLDHGIEVVGRNRPALISSAMTWILGLCKEKR
jgi:hypothetical protein